MFSSLNSLYNVEYFDIKDACDPIDCKKYDEVFPIDDESTEEVYESDWSKLFSDMRFGATLLGGTPEGILKMLKK
jgi:hypothetical protein